MYITLFYKLADFGCAKFFRGEEIRGRANGKRDAATSSPMSFGRSKRRLISSLRGERSSTLRTDSVGIGSPLFNPPEVLSVALAPVQHGNKTPLLSKHADQDAGSGGGGGVGVVRSCILSEERAGPCLE